MLSLLSIVWIAAGILGVVVIARGSIALGTLGLLLGVLSIGLWLQWRSVRVPLMVYWFMIGVCGLVLLFMRRFDWMVAVRTAGFFSFSYLVHQWRPCRAERALVNDGAK